MNCDETRKHWHLFHDSEGDAELHHQINEHLALCPDCSRWFYQQSRLEEALADKLRQGQPTPELWSTIRGKFLVKERAVAGSWFRIRGVFVLAACLLVAVGGLVWFTFLRDRGTTSPDLAALSVALHEKLATGREAVKLSSKSHVEVEDYLRQQVKFPVRCPPREDAGFQVEGGGICKFNADPVAYVVGQVDGQKVSLFIMARESLASFPAQRDVLSRQKTHAAHKGKCGVVFGEIGQNVVLVVGDLDSEKLLRVLNAYGTYGEHHSASLWNPAATNPATAELLRVRAVHETGGQEGQPI